MSNRNHNKRRNLLIGTLAVFAVASVILLAGGAATTKSAGLLSGPRLVAVQPLPNMDADGPMCQWQPAAAGEALLATLAQAPAGSSAASDARNLIRDRPPLRVIKDP